MVCTSTHRILWTNVYNIAQATCALLNGLVFSSYRFLMKAQLSDDRATPTLTQIFFAGAGTGMIGSYVVSVLQHLPSVQPGPQHHYHSDRAGQDSTAISAYTNIHPPDAPANYPAGRVQGALPGNYGDRSSRHQLRFLLLCSKSAKVPTNPYFHLNSAPLSTKPLADTFHNLYTRILTRT